MRRTGTALLAALAALACLAAAPPAPAWAGEASEPDTGLDHCTTGTVPIVCHFDVAPGDYDVTAVLGGEAEGATAVTAETRRAVLAETHTGAGEYVRRSFTVNVRTPEGEPTGATGTPGLDLYFGGSAPELAALRVRPSRHVPHIYLAGDSTVCDQPGEPYTGWGQELPQFLRRGVSVANYADSGESSGSFLTTQALFPTMLPLIRRGDLVLIQFGHNDKQTTAADYRANLTALVEGVREQGGRPVLVTPVVRRWFNSDGTLNNGIALHVNGLGVDLPAEMRSLAAEESVPLIDLTALTKALVESYGPEASKALYLYNEKRDNTHFSVTGATEVSQLVLGALTAQHLIPERSVRQP